MSRLGNVLVIHPDHTSVERIDMDDYRELVRLVNGNLGLCSLPPTLRGMGFFCYCDDDAMVRDNPPATNQYQYHLGKSHLRGPLVIVRSNAEGVEQGLSKKDIEHWESYLAGPPSPEAYKEAIREAVWWQMHPAGMAIREYTDADELLKDLGI